MTPFIEGMLDALYGDGEKIAIIAFGSMVAPSLTAADKLNATVADMNIVQSYKNTEAGHA